MAGIIQGLRSANTKLLTHPNRVFFTYTWVDLVVRGKSPILTFIHVYIF
jgi:hypothetical protein